MTRFFHGFTDELIKIGSLPNTLMPHGGSLEAAEARPPGSTQQRMQDGFARTNASNAARGVAPDWQSKVLSGTGHGPVAGATATSSAKKPSPLMTPYGADDKAPKGWKPFDEKADARAPRAPAAKAPGSSPGGAPIATAAPPTTAPPMMGPVKPSGGAATLAAGGADMAKRLPIPGSTSAAKGGIGERAWSAAKDFGSRAVDQFTNQWNSLDAQPGSMGPGVATTSPAQAGPAMAATPRRFPQPSVTITASSPTTGKPST